MQEYVVTVHDSSAWDTLWTELTTATKGAIHTPIRAVAVVNDRPFNDFCAHVLLTDDEAKILVEDPRVSTVELKASLQDDVRQRHHVSHTGNFNRSSLSIASSMKNWGLIRCVNKSDPFGVATALASSFQSNLDGTGVDVIIVDSGVEPNHPEFAINPDGTGGSRVVDYDWSTLNVPGVPSGPSIGGYLGDISGHGSNCASIACGSTQGWAPNAAIYSIRIFSGSNITTGTTLGSIDADYAYDLVRAFHLNKIAKGITRPTVCNSSWGYESTYSGLQFTMWRGNRYDHTVAQVEYGQVNSSHPYTINYVNTSVENCAAAGVILVGAAGNYSHKIDIPGGIDYDNFYEYRNNGSGEKVYYHRGASPTNAPSTICVGAVDNELTDTLKERKAFFSETGPRVDLYAPGAMIMGAYSSTDGDTAIISDPRSPEYYLTKISGSSQASPQVAGCAACILQVHPTFTPAEVKAFLIEHSVENILDQELASGTGYDNFYYLQDGPNRYLYLPLSILTTDVSGSVS